ncbi:MAG: hypothetical protein ACK5V3_04975, partial [Bdellovibrionales bacterium]
MGYFKLWYIPVLISFAEAAPLERCQSLVDQLNSLRKAQHNIITSLAQNHDVFADQLSALSFELALYKKNVPPKALSSMDKSAEAYRARSLKAFQTAEKLDVSTANLIKKIQSCLK